MFSRFFSRRRPSRAPRLLGLELLETREVPAVTLRSIADQSIANDRPIYIPITVTSTPAGTVTDQVSSNNAAVSASLLSGGRTVQFDISGKDSTGATFTGTLTIRLFEGSAPLTSQRIVDLINSGFYTNKIFHRVADLFSSGTTPDTDLRKNVIVQGGSPTGNGSGGSTLPDLVDEFDPNVTFASDGLVAMANARDDNNNAQFFFTDLSRPLAERVEFLNFNHTIFGILTDGFDTLTAMQTTPLTGTKPTTDLTITAARVLASDTENAVLVLTPQEGFTGTAQITVTADDGTGPTTLNFNATGIADTTNSRAFISNTLTTSLTTTAATPITFTVPATDIDGDTISIAVRNSDPGNSDDFTTAPANVNVQINQATRQVTLTPVAGFTGSLDFKVGVRDGTDRTGTGDTGIGNFDTQVVRLTVNAASPPTTSPPPPTSPPPTSPPTTSPPTTTDAITATGSAAGTESRVTVKNADGSVRFSVVAFPGFTGGTNVAVGDVTGDGNPDVVVTPGFGGGPVIKIVDGKTGDVIRTLGVFEDVIRGGLAVSVADAAGLGYAQITVGAGVTGGPRVSVLDVVRNQTLLNFFAGDPTSRTGVTVDVAKVVPTRGPMLIATQGPGHPPEVFLFDAQSGLKLGNFTAGDASNTTGIRARAGEPDAITGVRPILVAPFTAAVGTSETPFDPTRFIDFTKV